MASGMRLLRLNRQLSNYQNLAVNLELSGVSNNKQSLRYSSIVNGGPSVPPEKQTKNEIISKSSSTVINGSTDKAEKISRAMKAYLEHAQAHDGKRHLASIMGVNPDTFSQEEIDKAINYLLPSALFDKSARPMLKHPDEVIPKRKAAQFGADGRPFHAFFYTGKPNYAQAMHDSSMKIEELKRFEDSAVVKGLKADSTQVLQLAGSQWVDKVAVEQIFQEQLSDGEYQSLLRILEHISKLPHSVREMDLVFKYRKMLKKHSHDDDILPKRSSGSYQGVVRRRNRKMFVNGRSLLEHFPRIIDREQVIFPLQLTGKLQAVDFEATVEGGGPSGQAGAVRLALSLALRSMVDKTTVEKMRLAGLLTKDPRIVERQKPGQQGARRKYTWKKR